MRKWFTVTRRIYFYFHWKKYTIHSAYEMNGIKSTKQKVLCLPTQEQQELKYTPGTAMLKERGRWTCINLSSIFFLCVCHHCVARGYINWIAKKVYSTQDFEFDIKNMLGPSFPFFFAHTASVTFFRERMAWRDGFECGTGCALHFLFKMYSTFEFSVIQKLCIVFSVCCFFSPSVYLPSILMNSFCHFHFDEMLCSIY